MSIRHPVTCYSDSPHIRKLFELLNNTDEKVEALAGRIEVDKSTVYGWAHAKREPSITKLEKAFNVLGYTLVVRPLQEL